MNEYLQTAFSGPPLFASVLLVLVALYWLLVIFGTVDLEGLDFDFDVDVDGDFASVLSFGAAPLKLLNVGRVPFMLWLSAFVLTFWMISMLGDSPASRENGWNIAAVLVRNFAVGLLGAKLLTQPFCKVFESGRSNMVTTVDLIGRPCRATTRVNSERGQAKVDIDDGSPLLLSVRAADEELKRGQLAEIVDYDRERDAYLVRPASDEV